MSKSLNDMAPNTEMFHCKQNSRFNLWSDSQNCINLSACRIEFKTFGDHSFLVYSPRFWNELSPIVRLSIHVKSWNGSFRHCFPWLHAGLSCSMLYVISALLFPSMFVYLYLYFIVKRFWITCYQRCCINLIITMIMICFPEMYLPSLKCVMPLFILECLLSLQL